MAKFAWALLVVSVTVGVFAVESQSANPRCPANPSADLQCCHKPHSWPHSKRSSARSTATVTCNADGTQTVSVTSRSDTQLVRFIAQLITLNPATGAVAAQTLVNEAYPFVTVAAPGINPPTVQPGVQNTIPPVMTFQTHEPFDYDSYMEANGLKPRMADPAPEGEWPPSHSFLIPRDILNSSQPNQNRPDECNANRPHDEQIYTTLKAELVIRITEKFYVDGVVQLVTTTDLRPVCTTYIDQPAQPGPVRPICKNNNTQVCRQTEYKITALSAPPILTTTLTQVTHPTADKDVRWTIQRLSYSTDLLIDSYTQLPLFGTAGGQVYSSGVQPNSFRVITDSVLDPRPHNVVIAAGLSYCTPRAVGLQGCPGQAPICP